MSTTASALTTKAVSAAAVAPPAGNLVDDPRIRQIDFMHWKHDWPTWANDYETNGGRWDIINGVERFPQGNLRDPQGRAAPEQPNIQFDPWMGTNPSNMAPVYIEPIGERKDPNENQMQIVAFCNTGGPFRDVAIVESNFNTKGVPALAIAKHYNLRKEPTGNTAYNFHAIANLPRVDVGLEALDWRAGNIRPLVQSSSVHDSDLFFRLDEDGVLLRRLHDDTGLEYTEAKWRPRLQFVFANTSIEPLWIGVPTRMYYSDEHQILVLACPVVLRMPRVRPRYPDGVNAINRTEFLNGTCNMDPDLEDHRVYAIFALTREHQLAIIEEHGRVVVAKKRTLAIYELGVDIARDGESKNVITIGGVQMATKRELDDLHTMIADTEFRLHRELTKMMVAKQPTPAHATPKQAATMLTMSDHELKQRMGGTNIAVGPCNQAAQVSMTPPKK